jgi:hypothetical protein
MAVRATGLPYASQRGKAASEWALPASHMRNEQLMCARLFFEEYCRRKANPTLLQYIYCKIWSIQPRIRKFLKETK